MGMRRVQSFEGPSPDAGGPSSSGTGREPAAHPTGTGAATGHTPASTPTTDAGARPLHADGDSRRLVVGAADGPASAPASRPGQGLVPGPVWRYHSEGGGVAGDAGESAAGDACDSDDGGAAGRDLRATLPGAPVEGTVVREGDVLEYAVFAVLDRSQADIRDAYAATAVALDVAFDDGSRLGDTAPSDQHGVAVTPGAQYASRTVSADQWTFKRIALDAAVGRVVRSLEVRTAAVAPVAGGAALPVEGYVNAVRIAPGPADAEPLDLVRTTRGTHSTFAHSRGNTAPLVGIPHGGVFVTPVTDASTRGWVYSYHADNRDDGRPALQAFALSHIPSPWIGDRGVWQFLPHPDAQPPLGRAERALGFDHRTEVDRPHRYAVDLDGGIHAEVTAARFSAVARFTYPGPRGSVIFDQPDDEGGLTLPGPGAPGVVTGHVDGVDGSPRMFVYATLDRPVLASRVEGVRGSVALELGDGHQVTLRMGTSFLGPEQARRNLELDGVAGSGCEEVAARAAQLWRERLGQVEVDGASHDQLVTLYSNLYRLHLYPNDAAENVGTAEDPQWRYASPFHPLERPHTPEATGCRVVEGQLTVNNGCWDTYRTLWPALLLLCPADAGHLLDGLVQHYRDGGWTSRWTAPGPLDSMTGTTTDVIFSDAAARGVGGFDLDDAYASAVHNATVPAPDPRVGRKGIRSQTFRGFTDTSVAEGMSWTLDSAITDAAIARFATLLLGSLAEGDPRRDALEAEAEYFAARGARYATVFDPRTGFFLGRRPDGTWRVADPADYDPREWGFDYTETNGWGTAFTAPHDGAGLATLMGGPEALRRRLDEFFAEPETGRAEFKGSYDVAIHEMAEARDVRMGMLGLSNQPAHHIPFMYAFTGVHHPTQEVVREALRRLFLGSEIGQGYPGDEDNGEMSAWYLFAALGLYPLVPASGEFVITAPLFPTTRVHLPGGELEVGTSGEGDHVAAVWVDGEPWDRVSIPRERLVHGARIVVRLSPDPTDWARGTTPSSLTPTGARPRLRLDLTDPEGARTAASSTVGPADTVFDDRGAGVLPLDEGDRVSYRFGAARTTSLYTVTTDTGAAASWDLEARAGDGEWELLDRRRDEVFTWEGQTRPFRIRGARRTGHEEYRIVARSALRLVQWELLGDD